MAPNAADAPVQAPSPGAAERLNRAFALLAGFSAAMARARDQSALCEAVCRAAVNDGGFRAAWMVHLDDRGQVASLQAPAGLPDPPSLSGPASQDTPAVDGLPEALARASRSGQPQVVGPARADQDTVAAFPITLDGRVQHLLGVCAAPSHGFDAEQLGLLAGLARNLGLALDQLRAEDLRRRELARYRLQLEELVATRTAELEQANARLQREDRRLRALLWISQRASSLSEQQLCQAGVDELVRLTGSPVVSLHAVDESALQVGTQAAHGDSEPPDGDPEPLWRQALRRRAVVRGAGGAGRPLHTLVAVPVFDEGRVCLVVCASLKVGRAPEADERELSLFGADLWRIVRRRRIELALEEAKHTADAANLAKGVFLANMSHEIRTPLNAIIGFAHLLRRDPLSPRQIDHLDRIADAGQHLLQVINDILDFSKIEAHKVALAASDFDLREAVQRVLAMVADRAHAKGLALHLQCELGSGAVHADRLRLEQVLLNLVGNAIKFTLHGEVRVRLWPLAGADTVPGDGGDPDHRWRFEVQDTGIGIDAAQVPHLFEAFEQADASTTRRFGGTGLGLAICKRLVALMGGQIGVRSQDGQGSTFWFELPLPPAHGQVAPLPPPTPARPGVAAAGPTAAAPGAASGGALEALAGARVLLVEDNPINQEVASDLLQSMGVSVDLASGGDAAVAKVRDGHHDLVLMDVQMPGMDGLRATAAIRALPGRQRLPIVAMTANAFADDRDQCLAAGMDDYLAKPVEPRVLQRCLLRWLAGRPPAAPSAASPAAGRADAADAGPAAPPQPRPAPAALDAWQTRLADLPGLDLARGLARVNGHWRLYARALTLFCQHHADDARRLQALAEAGDAAAAKRLAHATAGAAATLGAEAVAGFARALDLAIPPGAAAPAASAPAQAQAWQARVPALAQALQAFVDALKALPPMPPLPSVRPPEPRPARAPDRSAARACLLRLQPLLHSHDTAAGAVVEAHAEVLTQALGPLAAALQQQILSFSFEEARHTLGLALQRLQAPRPDRAREPPG